MYSKFEKLRFLNIRYHLYNNIFKTYVLQNEKDYRTKNIYGKYFKRIVVG